MLVTEVLEEHGYSGIEASDGPCGLRILESDAKIDLLITDVGLPGGINGRQFADAARVRVRNSRSCSSPAMRRTPSSATASSRPACGC